ncbi:MAG: MaoC family dehydratase [Candidatus Melainabacteria bacterium]|nr:MaoC family dehydratase [Candidatus Melainabacteria bacterium]
MSAVACASTLVVVDMQPRYQASRSIVRQVEDEIGHAVDNGWPVIVLQYKNMGRTHKRLLDALHHRGARYVLRVKARPDGSHHVAEACLMHGFPTSRFRLCGVNALACVKQTALGLNARFPGSRVEVVKSACNGPGVVDWSRFPSRKNLILVSFQSQCRRTSTMNPVRLETGATASYSRTVTGEDIVAFANVTGDSNPVHLDEEHARQTPFKRRIAHGMLTGSYISTVLGTILPGPGTIYLEQNLKFRAPVFIGDTITARVTVESYDEAKGIAALKTDCVNQDGKVVIEGSAKILYRR